MSYIKTNWTKGDIITAQKLNKIENGIENSLLESLELLGKALCGNDFELASNVTDAEAIQAIARNYTGGGSSGGCDIKTVTLARDGGKEFVTDGLTWEELTSRDNPCPPILMKEIIAGYDKTYERYIGSVWSFSGANVSSGNVLGVVYTTFMLEVTLSEEFLPVTAGYTSVLFTQSDSTGHEGQIEVTFFNGGEPTWREF